MHDRGSAENPSGELLQEVTFEVRKWLRYYQSIGFSSISRTPDTAEEASNRPLHSNRRLSAPTSPITASAEMSSMRVISSKEPELPKSKSSLPETPTPASGATETLAAIRKDLGEDCQRCKLAGGRKTIVFGSGNEKAKVVFVGEGPGADEDEQGLPFVGRAGQLLTDMIEKGMQIPRPDVYICNIVKCRPPQNRKPEADEVAACRPFVERQIRAIRPKVICALGATAAETLLGMKESMGRLRGKQYDFAGIPLIVTYHPAFLLRDPSRKADAWADLKMVMSILNK